LIELTGLRLPPSANRLWRKGKNHIYKSDEYHGWMQTCGWHIAITRPQKITGPYALTVLLSRPDKRKRDLDNFAFKAVNDLLVKHRVVEEDSLCDELFARWVTDGSEGMTVRIRPIMEL
jgi:Holliday junction resolvase RusA-like endonuclease